MDGCKLVKIKLKKKEHKGKKINKKINFVTFFNSLKPNKQ